MKLLQMPSKRQSMGVGADEQQNVLTHVWATDGALAHAVAPAPVAQQTEEERAAPVFRKLLAPGTAFYRSYTEAMLRRYGVLSMESGRVPSLLGREMFRGKVTSYRVHAFDDVVIFVHDVDRCIAELEPEQQRLILRIGVQEYTLEEAASMFRLSLRSVQRRYFQALDELTSIFLRKKLLERIASDPCQEGEATVKLVSHSPDESCEPKFVGM
ncbi:sigma factor-like helix-turn-helix DNA-binding protein [Terriglobus sp. TAA 43]|uniref:sigma factor-like helix-turn-helix DNA-binding protein n=1 Tax=Terriglobus sp. TAA 43 TaxID=278961 RepID=UPI000689C1D0|nr:sigma factor-like helix-turn-helix DNA-binding protein [Terriglobus sp. TAA 43]